MESVGWRFRENMTGTTAKIGLRIEDVHMGSATGSDLTVCVLLLLSFMGGSFLCGLLIDKNQVHLGGKAAYGLALLGNSLLLVGTTLIAPDIRAAYLAAAASGLQNAMCTSHFGAVVRTTHVTGTATDIGSTLGRTSMLLLRSRGTQANLNLVQRAELEVDFRKLAVLLPLFFSFVSGCTTGAYLAGMFGKYAFLVPAGVTGFVGFAYMCFRQRMKQMIKKNVANRMGAELHEVSDILVSAHKVLCEIRRHNSEEANHTPNNDDGAIVSLDEEVSHALEIVHDIEADLDEYLEGPAKHYHVGKSFSAPA